MIRSLLFFFCTIVWLFPDLSAQAFEPEDACEEMKGQLIERISYAPDEELGESLRQVLVRCSPGAEDSLNWLYEVGKTYWTSRNVYPDLSGAERWLKEAVALRYDPQAKTAMSHYILGMLYARKRDHLRSKYHYEAVIEQADLLGSRKDKVLARTYHFLGKQYTRLGDYQQALSLYQASLDLGDKSRESVNFLEMGTAYLYQQKIAEAERHYLLALETGGLDPSETGTAYDNLADTYLALGRISEAMSHAESAREYFEEVDDQHHVAECFKTMGDISQKAGQQAAALAYYHQALEAATIAYKQPYNREVAKIHLALGSMYLQEHQADSAQKAYHQALRCVMGKGLSDDMDELPSSEDFYPENVIMEALEGKALAFMESGSRADLETAMACFQLIGKVEDLLRLSFDFAESKYLLVDESHRRTESALEVGYALYLETGEEQYLAKGWELAERSKAMVLLETLKRREALEAALLPDSLRFREQDLLVEIQNLEKRRRQEGEDESLREHLFDQRQALGRLESYLEKNFPDYYAVKYDLEVPSLEELSRYLDQREQVMIAYFEGDEHIYAFVISPQVRFWKKLPKSETWQMDFRSFLANLSTAGTGDAGAFAQESHAWYESLIAPLVLPRNPRLLIVPDGQLSLLPFEVLVTMPLKESNSFRDLAYFLEDYQISYAYSATSLLGLSERKRHHASDCSFLAFAPGSFELTGLVDLPSTRQEVESLGNMMAGQSYVGSEATKAQFLETAPVCQVLHLSTHALGWDSSRQTAWIAFAGPEKEALLTLEELYGLRLHNELTVLSACETGNGTLQRGEGVLSLARGFTYAGSQSIVKTLWSVNPAASEKILQAFYQGLTEGMTKDEALYQAKLAYIHDKKMPAFLASPHLWAAFVAIGDMQALPDSRGLGMAQVIFLSLLIVLLSGMGFVLWKGKNTQANPPAKDYNQGAFSS